MTKIIYNIIYKFFLSFFQTSFEGILFTAKLRPAFPENIQITHRLQWTKKSTILDSIRNLEGGIGNRVRPR